MLLSTNGPAWQQVGEINSVGALHDARSKQVPSNPLRARKTSVGQAANPVIRQQSVAQQAQAKQTRHFAGGLLLYCPSHIPPLPLLLPLPPPFPPPPSTAQQAQAKQTRHCAAGPLLCCPPCCALRCCQNCRKDFM